MINFPSSPAVNDTVTSGTKKWTWDGTSWVSTNPLLASSLTGVLGIANGGTGNATGTAADSSKLFGYPGTASGARWGIAPYVGVDGVMEIGKYLDFHDTNGDTGDYSTRVQSSAGTLLVNGSALTTIRKVAGAASTAGTLDWNDATNTAGGVGPTLLMGNASNGPGPASYFHTHNYEYASTDGTGNVTQLAVPYGSPADRMFLRGRYNTVWTGWRELVITDTSGKVGIGGASPDARLAVYQSANGWADGLRIHGSTTANYWDFLADSAGVTLRVGYQANTRMTIDGATGAVNFPGAVTASSFTGNVTGNCSGSSGSCTGNAATATTATNHYGAGGNYIASSGNGTSYSTAIQVREAGLGGAQGSAAAYAPRLAFHWSAVVASSITMVASGSFEFRDNPGTGWASCYAYDFITSSDRRLKENISPVEGGLAKVLAMQGVTYDIIAAPEKGREMGLIAQDVQPICPELVREDGQGMLAVSYGHMAAVFIEAIKEQQKQIDELKALVAKLAKA